MDRATDPGSDEARGARDLLLELDLRRGRMRSELAEALRAAIQDGRLGAGEALPASRRLAGDLQVSRGVVSDAYDRLASEGYLEVRSRSAPVVAAVVATPPPVVEPVRTAWRFDFDAVSPDLRLFPRRAWVRATESGLRDVPDAALDYGDHQGRPELRRGLAAYLGRTRGVRIDPGRIVITQGFTQALYLLCRLLADRGAAAIAVESPSHPDLRTTIRTAGLEPVGCPVDADGIRTADLDSLDVDAVVVAPAHQFPTGAVLAPARRAALIRWAATRTSLVIEDDYDAEFRYDRSPVGAVQGLDPGRVAHVGTASKTLAPGVRLGWVSLPPALVDDVRVLKGATDSGSPIADQLALAQLLTTGAYERHVVRARHVYRRRRDHLVRALSARLPRLSIMGAAAGMQLLLRLPDGEDDAAIARTAAGRGIGVGALSPLHLSPSPVRGLLLGYGRLPETRITAAVDALATVLGRGRRA